VTGQFDDLPRTTQPIPDRPQQAGTTFDAKDSQARYPPIVPLRPVSRVQLDIGDDDHDHLISPEERLGVAMNRQ
jgi:hypothetical protein